MPFKVVHIYPCKRFYCCSTVAYPYKFIFPAFTAGAHYGPSWLIEKSSVYSSDDCDSEEKTTNVFQDCKYCKRNPGTVSAETHLRGLKRPKIGVAVALDTHAAGLD